MSELTGRYKAYPKYKIPDAEWLEAVPVNWDVVRVKSLLNLKRELVGSESGSYQLLSLTLNGVIPRDISNGGGKIPAEFNTYQSVNPRDLIFCLFDIDETPRTVGFSEHYGMITGAYSVYKCTSETVGKFVYYYFLHIDTFKGLKPFYTGLRKVVRSDTFASIKMPVPPPIEQTQIANFLDHETAKIDTLIAKQQQLIKLLKEKRQAVISHAVTKGLNPGAPMKDSGVEWLGEVPEHWEVTRLKYECSQIVDCMHSTPQYDQNGKYPAIRTADISPGHLDIRGARRVIENVFHERNGRLKPKHNDIIYSREGERYGLAALVPENVEVCLAQRVMLFRTTCSASANFLMWHLNANSVYMQAYQDVIGSTAPHINVETIKNFYLAWPPVGERQDIAVYIDEKLKKFDRLTMKAETKILLLKERRTALISAAVTGKIDVRNWKP